MLQHADVPTLAASAATALQTSRISMGPRGSEPAPRRRLFGRRALLAGAGVAAVAGAAELAPRLGSQAEQQIEQQLRQQFEAGLAAGRQALARELASLEGQSLDAAIEVADLTKLGTSRIVKPLADLATATAGDLLATFEGAVRRARGALAFFHVDAGALATLATLLATWRGGLTRAQLGEVAERDVTLADLYLRLLKAKLDQESNPPSPAR